MNQKFLFALGAIIFSASAHADWVISTNLNTLTDGREDRTLASIGVSTTLGYRFDVAENFKLVPELRFGGYGLPFDEGIYYGANLRGEYMLPNDLYLIGIASYQKFDVDVAFTRNDIDESEPGFGVGGGWQVSSRAAVEIYYERIDELNSFALGYRLNF
jgi:hypothetical protein